LKVEAVAKSGNDTRVGMSDWRGGGRDDEGLWIDFAT
jgi:hypothetical protein